MSDRREELFIDSARKLNQSLQLENILMVKLEAHVITLTDNPEFAFKMDLGQVGWARLASGVLADFPVEVVIQDKSETGQPVDLGAIGVAVRAGYSALGDLTAEQETAIPDFLGLVGWMHVWPYVRAEVQSISTKLGFPPLTLPILLGGQTSKVPVVREHDARTIASPVAHDASGDSPEAR